MKIVRRVLACAFLGLAAIAAADPTTVWTLADPRQIGGQAPTVWGAPQPAADGSLRFDGAADGLVLPVNPISGWGNFTVAVLFLPEAGGPDAQRFVHIEDTHGARLTVEDRLVPGKGWYMDTFLLSGSGPAASRRALIDPAKLHPLGQWAWAELVYDGRRMTAYVDGIQELAGEIAFPPMTDGRTSIGVRLNRIYWFKGLIREIRFYRMALAPAELPRAR